tara:strand:- start:3397 stop:3954 length:558 start_codon:yes stop_codon:yes gene_type:complete
MIVTRLGKRYAKSLLELAQELGKVEEVKADMATIQNAIEGSREFSILINSPVINPNKKIAIFKELFDNKLSELTCNFLEIITKKGREKKLGAIAQGFLDLYRIKNGISVAIVTTAVALSDSEREAIRSKIAEATGRQIEIEEKVDASIIGGMTLRLDDKEFNGSMAYKLNNLKRQFSDNLYVPEF